MVCRLDTREPDQFLLDVSLKTFDVGMEEGGMISSLKPTSSTGKRKRSASYEEAGEEIREMIMGTKDHWDEVKDILTNAQSTTNVAGKPTPLSDELAKEDWYDIIEKRTMRLKRVKEAGAGDGIISICEKGLSEAVEKFKNLRSDE